MGFLEKVEQWVEKKVNPAEHHLEVTNKAQMELMMAFGEDRSWVWIDAYSRRFRELVDEREVIYLTAWLIAKHTMMQSKK